MERHEAREARVIPIILRSAYWKGASFEKLQVRPKDAKPVQSWNSIDEAFTNVAEGIANVVEPVKTAESTPVNAPQPNDECQNAASIDLTQMDFSPLARLVDALLACPNVSNRYRRDTIVNRLPDDIKSFASATKKF